MEVMRRSHTEHNTYIHVLIINTCINNQHSTQIQPRQSTVRIRVATTTTRTTAAQSSGRRCACRRATHLELVDGHPAVGGDPLQDGDEPLHAAVPVAEQQHEADEVEDAHELAGHLQELRTRRTHTKQT